MATNALAAVLDDKSLVEDVRRFSQVDNWKSAGVIARLTCPTSLSSTK